MEMKLTNCRILLIDLNPWQLNRKFRDQFSDRGPTVGKRSDKVIFYNDLVLTENTNIIS